MRGRESEMSCNAMYNLTLDGFHPSCPLPTTIPGVLQMSKWLGALHI